MQNQWWIFDALEIVMGPFETQRQALDTLHLHINELYLEDDYPNAYVAQEADGEDYFNPEEYWDAKYKHVYENGIEELENMCSRENYRKRGSKHGHN